MRFWISPYELNPRRALSERAGGAPRAGTLVRVEFETGVVGYADLHPWTELGDAPLSKQVRSLGGATPTRLARNSLRFAQLDAEARARGQSLWTGLARIPASHFLLPFGEGALAAIETGAHAGFSRFKW